MLDTNVVSDLRRVDRGKTSIHFARWSAEAKPRVLFISVITILEIEQGILSLKRRDAPQAAMLNDWLETRVIGAFGDHILPVDTAIAQCCARLHVPNTRNQRDAFIAATAIVHSMTVVTRNVVDFEPTGVEILNPWVDRGSS